MNNTPKSGSMIHKDGGQGVKPDYSGQDGAQNTNVGSGSRPTKSMIPIPTSAPMNAHTLGRDVPGSLK